MKTIKISKEIKEFIIKNKNNYNLYDKIYKEVVQIYKDRINIS
jgi:hypothetical protein